MSRAGGLVNLRDLYNLCKLANLPKFGKLVKFAKLMKFVNLVKFIKQSSPPLPWEGPIWWHVCQVGLCFIGQSARSSEPRTILPLRAAALGNLLPSGLDGKCPCVARLAVAPTSANRYARHAQQAHFPARPDKGSLRPGRLGASQGGDRERFSGVERADWPAV